jgi:hypothetical protein
MKKGSVSTRRSLGLIKLLSSFSKLNKRPHIRFRPCARVLLLRSLQLWSNPQEESVSKKFFEKFSSLNFSAMLCISRTCSGDHSMMAFSIFVATLAMHVYLRFGGTNSLGPPESWAIGRQPHAIASIKETPKCSFMAQCK